MDFFVNKHLVQTAKNLAHFKKIWDQPTKRFAERFVPNKTQSLNKTVEGGITVSEPPESPDVMLNTELLRTIESDSKESMRRHESKLPEKFGLDDMFDNSMYLSVDSW